MRLALAVVIFFVISSNLSAGTLKGPRFARYYIEKDKSFHIASHHRNDTILRPIATPYNPGLDYARRHLYRAKLQQVKTSTKAHRASWPRY